MSVYTYRPTMKTVKTTSGAYANVHECLGPGPYYNASNRAQANWDRKISTGIARAAKVDSMLYYCESDKPGEPVYVGCPKVYTDARDYVVARDENGHEIFVA